MSCLDIEYPGQHDAIVDQATWDQVQTMLADHVQGERVYQKTTGALLAGKVLGPDGDPLITAHTSKPGKTGRPMRYRYYVSQTMHHNGGQGGTACPRARSKAW